MKRRFIIFFLATTICLSVIPSVKVSAQTNDCNEQQLKALGVAMLNCGEKITSCEVSPTFGSSNENNIGSEFTRDQVLAFAHSSIDSTWGISDSVVEQWFLKQAGARRVIGRYGLNTDNINNITATIKSHGISPVFFYAYTVNEGGGAGGFINHFKGDTLGGGVGNASRDAKYLIDASNNSGFKPSWIDAGNPVDFVPQEIKNSGNTDFDNMPPRTVGRSYIPATAATTWEVYYPDGLKKEFNKIQNYGHPLNDTMSNIKKMGGDPMQGGSNTSVGCSNSNTVTGEGMTKAINWTKMIANNDGYGYDQTNRTSGWKKWQEDPNCLGSCGSFDCSTFVAGALTVGGYFKENPQFSTSSMVGILSKQGFTNIGNSVQSADELKPGDVLIRTGHTALYIGDNQIAHASINENRGTTGGKVGDQTSKEVYVTNLYELSWDKGIWRAPN